MSVYFSLVATVSTHSRPKAVGLFLKFVAARLLGFNTQPPEGGWNLLIGGGNTMTVSTHSRPKAVGAGSITADKLNVFQHTAARRRLEVQINLCYQTTWVSTHSRPKAVGSRSVGTGSVNWFQHTAARRRLAAFSDSQRGHQVSFNTQPPEGGWGL